MTTPPPVRELSDEARYAALSARFRPVFGRIAEGALERESNHVLPFEQVAWLKEAASRRCGSPPNTAASRSATSTCSGC